MLKFQIHKHGQEIADFLKKGRNYIVITDRSCKKDKSQKFEKKKHH